MPPWTNFCQKQALLFTKYGNAGCGILKNTAVAWHSSTFVFRPHLLKILLEFFVHICYAEAKKLPVISAHVFSKAYPARKWPFSDPVQHSKPSFDKTQSKTIGFGLLYGLCHTRVAMQTWVRDVWKWLASGKTDHWKYVNRNFQQFLFPFLHDRHRQKVTATKLETVLSSDRVWAVSRLILYSFGTVKMCDRKWAFSVKFDQILERVVRRYITKISYY